MFRKLAPLALAFAVVATLTTLGCDGDDGGPAVVVTVVVSPDSAMVDAGATTQYTAQAFDGSGNPISGLSFTWSSADQSVASVDNTGLATGVVMGTTYIRASTGGVIDSVKIVVIPNSQPDPPDDLFQDTNGDGIDGEVAGAVFVAPPPTGDDGNAGTPDEPKATIAAAIAAAVADANKDQVYISSGTYSETVTLVAGISLYGGYDAASDWDRSFSNTATIDGDTTAVIGASISQPTVLDLLTIESADNTEPGGNSTGIYLSESTFVTLRNLTVTAGAGGAGIAGTAGAAGAVGLNGQNASIVPPAGGAGGDTVPGGDPQYPPSGKGGDGGNGATTFPAAGGDGGDGLPTPGGGLGGAGGPDPTGEGDLCNLDGLPGSNGGVGADGLDGLAGSGGSGAGNVIAGRWFGDAGDAGTRGDPAFGGGGGGGGSAGREQSAMTCYAVLGGGGGGGGSGGQAGEVGEGGTGGGGSFGIFVYNTTVDIEASTITSGNGGDGGDGGAGGVGGAGGSGGQGSNGDVSQLGFQGGPGGDGGNGGQGGDGGPGGGGGGGVSYPVYAAGTSNVTINGSTTLAHGTGGAGGAAAPGGNGGQAGDTDDTNF
jgi:hypothetical protein